jgi:di/tricarboxylate transporter
MNWGLISLLALVIAIVLGFFRKLNVGILAIAFAVPLGKLAGMTDGQIISGWSTSLAMMLMGVTFIFSIAQTNGTLELFARKAIAMTGKSAWAVPIVIFWLCAFLAAVGPGTVPVMTLMVPLSVALAVEMKISPLMIAPITVLGSAGGGLTPIAPTGIIGLTLAAQQGFTGLEIPYALNSMTSEFFVAIVIYFVFGGHKLRGTKDSTEVLPPFTTDQKFTMIGIACVVIAVLFLKVNVGLAAFVVGVVLLSFKVVDERQTIRNMPWGTILLVCGVGVLMNLAIKLKGIELLAKTLATFMTAETAAPIISLSAGVMSWFSSTSGVVMPTLIPTISGLLESVPGTTPIELLSAITFGAHTAGISPASTGGALALAAYAGTSGISPAEQNKLFMQMFLTAVGGVVLVSLFAATGAYHWFDFLMTAPK